MKIFILGAAGMLGHKLYQAYQSDFEVWATVRGSYRDYAQYDLFHRERLIEGVDAFNFDTITRALVTVQPDVVINCIGIIKQLATAKDPIISLTINSLLPHRLAVLCQAAHSRMFHISTDCVFSGRKGMYTEQDISDAEDLYGRTKFLGEVDAPGCITLRTSIIGRELNGQSGLVEWFLSNQGGKIRGYSQAIYSGFTTQVMAAIIKNLIERQPELCGVYQVSSEPINKYDLLLLLKEKFEFPVDIAAYPDVQIDRSLDSSRFRTITAFKPPSWSEMIHEMANDPTPYNSWRKS